MAIKVLSRKIHKIECVGCGANLQFEIEDLVPIIVNGSYCESGAPAAGVPCPDCSTKTEYEEAPYEVIRKLHATKPA